MKKINAYINDHSKKIWHDPSNLISYEVGRQQAHYQSDKEEFWRAQESIIARLTREIT